MRLTPRDLEIFQLLTKTAILTTAQINRRIFPGIAGTTVLRRLRKLERARYVQRIEGLPKFERAWALQLKGAEAVGYVQPKRHFHRLALAHDVALSGLRLVLEDHGIARSWIPEHEIRSAMARKHGLKRMKAAAVPDGIMGVRYKGVMESAAIELELHYKNKDRYREIFRSYLWKENTKAVWYFVPSPSLGQHLEKLWRKFNGESGPWFLWSKVGDVMLNGGRAAVHYRDQVFQIESLFEAASEGEKPAHPGGLGVSKAEQPSPGEKIHLTPRDMDENGRAAS